MPITHRNGPQKLPTTAGSEQHQGISHLGQSTHRDRRQRKSRRQPTTTHGGATYDVFHNSTDTRASNSEQSLKERMAHRTTIQLQKPLLQPSPGSIYMDEDEQRTPTELAAQDWKDGIPLLPVRPSRCHRRTHHLPLRHLGPHKTFTDRTKKDLDRTGHTNLDQDRIGEGGRDRRGRRMVHTHFRLSSQLSSLLHMRCSRLS